MLKYLDKYIWLYSILAFITCLTCISLVWFIAILINSTIPYIYYGIFQFSEVQIRALFVVLLLNVPTLVFWFILFIIHKVEKSKLKTKEILC